MKDNMHKRLYWREVGQTDPASSVSGLYGDHQWVQDLDIVNELGGHTGCVNALSWSKSGRLLASGSDDTHLLIHSYQPDNSNAPFSLSTSLSTGHTANIFSVKFMPHSNDRTVVTAAGDAECRVFDLEYDGKSTVASGASSVASVRQRRRGTTALPQGTRYLTDGNTNARVYRSHADRVKRIVTESSPHLFLTCSEDGTVRQWDLRQPSSAYPPPRGGRGFQSHRDNHDDSNVPPPLISYKRYRLDLNTISCSGSQPHYIVLGGAHLHCFLHDRRMLGRDRLAERGASVNGGSSPTEAEDDLMGEATRCVRRFAPNGRRKMKRHDNGHVTACKISDANPNEMIGSWSGDHIYSFDLVRSADACDPANNTAARDVNGKGKSRVRESRDRKRKRKQIPSSSSMDQTAESSKSRRTSVAAAENGDEDDDLVLRLRYENGQSEDIAIATEASSAVAEQARESMLSDAQRRSQRIAKSLVRIRKLMFSLDVSSREHEAQTTDPLAAHQSTFTSIVGLCAANLPEIDDINSHWLFPTRPSSREVDFHTTLRANRDQSRRVVLAAGALARSLGGKLQTAGSGASLLARLSRESPSPPMNARLVKPGTTFSYFLLRAILLWLDHGIEALVKGFEKKNSTPHMPIPEGETGESAIDEHLVPFLQELANDTPVSDVDASRFEHDKSRYLFASEKAALTAFSRAVKIPLQDMAHQAAFANGDQGHAASDGPAPAPAVRTQDKEAARRFWAFRVGRGLLLKAGAGVNFAFVDRAFGGLGRPTETEEGRAQDDIDPDEEEQEVESVNVRRTHRDGARAPPSAARSHTNADPSQWRHPLVAAQTAEAVESQKTSAQPPATERQQEDVQMADHPAPASDEPTMRAVFAQESYLESLEEQYICRPADTTHANTNDNDENGIAEDEDDAEEGAAHELEEDDDDDDFDDDGDDDDNEADETESEDDDGSDMDVAVGGHSLFRSLGNTGTLRQQVHTEVPVDSHTRVYRGHCNVKTTKDVNFFGLHDEYVVSGSDSGHVFVWDRKTSQLLNILEGDGEVVNVVQGHPHEPMMAASGIDSTIKIFSPDRRAQRDARLGRNLGITPDQDIIHSSIAWSRRRRSNRQRDDNDDTPAPEPAAPTRDDDADEGETDDAADPAVPPRGGRASRRRMRDSYQITSQNDVERRGGQRDAFLTRGMLARLAAHMRQRHGAEGGEEQGDGEEGVEDGEGGAGPMVVLDDNCQVM